MDDDTTKPVNNDSSRPRTGWQNDVMSSLHEDSKDATAPASRPYSPESLPPVTATPPARPMPPLQSFSEPTEPDPPTDQPAPGSVSPTLEPASEPQASELTVPQPAAPEHAWQVSEDSKPWEPGAPKGEPGEAWHPDKPYVPLPRPDHHQVHDDFGPLPPPDHPDVMPLAVVEVVSPRGVEYAMMTLTLWVAAISLLGVLLSLINGGAGYAVLAFPSASLIISLPLFSFFFLRFKKQELAQPELKLDPSKRRFSQFTQIIAYATCLFTLIAFVYFIISKISGQGGVSMLKAILDVIVVLAVAGGILAYYWNDEHRPR